jgi:hypothetical protein
LQPALGWSWAYNLNLRGKDVLPKNQTDWPNPAGHTKPTLLQIWTDSLKLPLAAKPFAQTDWPNPTGHTLPTLLQTWLFSRAFLYPVPQIPPGEQFFERPQLRIGQPADQFFIGLHPFITPVPPPAIGASYRLLSDHYLYGYYYKPNTIITEGVEIPFGWVPTLAVDPLNAQAIAAFYAAGPRSVDYGDLSTYTNMYKREFADVPVAPPHIFWQQVSGTKTYQLKGTALPPIGGN